MAPKLVPPANQPSVSSFFKRKAPSESPTQPIASSSTSSASYRPLNASTIATSPPTTKRPKIEFETLSDEDEYGKAIVLDWTPSPPAKSQAGSSSSVSATLPTTRTQARPWPTSPHPTASPSVSLVLPSSKKISSTLPLAQARLQRWTHVSEEDGAAPEDPSDLASSVRSSLPTLPPLSPRSEQRRQKFREMHTRSTIGRRHSLTLEEAEASAAGCDGADSDQDEPDEGDAEDDEEIEIVGAKMKGLKKKLTKAGSVLKGKGKAKEEIGPSGQTYTPLEKQVLQLKAENPGVLLIFEVGYKCKFFGEDAKIAAKHLNIVAFPSRNFMTASIPVHRLSIHIKSLIHASYKVGVVSQTETAALKKVGTNKSAPFTRKLTALYTSTTWVDELSSFDSSDLGLGNAVPPSGAMVVIVEAGALKGKNKNKSKQQTSMSVNETEEADAEQGGPMRIAIISVVPSTGDLIWDEFVDSSFRTELETRMTHIQPQELLLPISKMSSATEKMLANFTIQSSTNSNARARVERIRDDLDYAEASSRVASFYAKKQGDQGANVAATVTDLPKHVILALAYAIRYLEEFKLDSTLLRPLTTLGRFTSASSHMLLSANTLRNLEVYRNSDDGGQKGSLLWLLDHTTTTMGKRMLREWVGRPLIVKAKLEERVGAVQELVEDGKGRVVGLKALMKGMPDLMRGLVRIQSSRCTPSELLTVLLAFKRISVFLKTNSPDYDSTLLRSIVSSFPTIAKPLEILLEAIDQTQARDNQKADLWQDIEKYPAIEEAKSGIALMDYELQQELARIRTILKRSKATFVTVAGVENLIEVSTSDAKKVPASWVKISTTKKAVRFHTPEVLRISQEKEQYREILAAEADDAFKAFLAEVNESHDLFRTVASNVAALDCLLSLALTATQPGFTRPTFTDEHQLSIEGGFHPMVAALRDEPYIPNGLVMSASNGRTKIITGPNMGGKSSVVRLAALTVLLGQIGSYVPATSVSLGLHDAILTRMGANDDIVGGKSTFFVEVSETANIMRLATSRSLVVLDELGRGTSSNDGVAIAEAVLHHLVTEIHCNTLFITHYPSIAISLSRSLNDVSNWHMGYRSRPRADGESSEITFLYRLAPGLARASFGIECARLAGVPDEILKVAAGQSKVMAEIAAARTQVVQTRQMRSLFKTAFVGTASHPRGLQPDDSAGTTITQHHLSSLQSIGLQAAEALRLSL